MRLCAKHRHQRGGIVRLDHHGAERRDLFGDAFGRAGRKHDRRRTRVERNDQLGQRPAIVAVGQIHVEDEDVGPDRLQFGHGRRDARADRHAFGPTIEQRLLEPERQQRIVFDNQREAQRGLGGGRRLATRFFRTSHLRYVPQP